MIHIAVCDDEAYILSQLEELLKELEAECEDKFAIDCFSSAEELLRRPSNAYDVLLLDISMGDITGMEAAHRIREKNENATILFITSMIQYALEGYEVHAFAFLPKPVEKEKYKAVLKKAISWHVRQFGNTIIIKCGAEINCIASGNINYIEVMNHRLRVATEHGEAISYTPLHKLEEQIPAGSFYRCHKSYIVRLGAIQQILSDSVVMKDGSVIPLSKHRKNDFLAAFSRYAARRE